MSSWHSYPSIYALSHRAVRQFFEVDVIGEEKVDGSQFSFGKFDGEIKLRSKGVVMHEGQDYGMFKRAAEAVTALGPKLIEGWTYRAEYLQKPKHNVLAYNRIPTNHIILFDVCTGEEEYLPYAAKAEEAARLGLEVVPKLFEGRITAEVLTELLESVSVLGGQKIEGIVFKPVGMHLYGPDKKALIAKHVSCAFKEVHVAEWKIANPGRADVVASIIHSLKTPARWQKGVQHLRERGELEESPRDIGKLMKEVQADLTREMREEVAERLVKHFWPTILRGATSGLPEWYKAEIETQMLADAEDNTLARDMAQEPAIQA